MTDAVDRHWAEVLSPRRRNYERFKVELGDWNLEPRGPHVTPSSSFLCALGQSLAARERLWHQEARTGRAAC